MAERTADLRRLVELGAGLEGGDGPVVAVIGHACPWRDDLVDVLAERLPGVAVTAYDAPPARADLTVWLEVGAGDAWLQAAKHQRETSGGRARGEPLLPGGRWAAASEADDPPLDPVSEVDVVFVPVSGVRPPRRVRLFWDYSADVLWDDDNAYLGELEDLLPMSEDLRRRLKAWARRVDDADGADDPAEVRGLARELGAALGPDFRVET